MIITTGVRNVTLMLPIFVLVLECAYPVLTKTFSYTMDRIILFTAIIGIIILLFIK